MICEEVHRHLASRSVVIFITSPPQITGQGAEIEARREGVWITNTGFTIL